MIFPPGHFYSPIIDPDDLRAREDIVWQDTDSMLGIDLRINEQLALLAQLARHVPYIDYPQQQPASPDVYFYDNDQYPRLDAEFLFAFLCHRRPRRMIEVGSGFSSLVTADVNRRRLDYGLDFTCVEPYPRQFLLDGINGISRIVQEKVENIDVSFFDSLDAGDVLFVDSSHISKTGSDVNYIFFEILPRLKKGVYVHIHDIFLPYEYPRKWVLDDGRNWNEQYLLRAFLQFNSEWKIIWMAYHMGRKHPEAVRSTFPRFAEGLGGSFWIERV